MTQERDCNKCVYSTRDGNCRKWECEGTKTVEDIKAEVIAEIHTELIGEIAMLNVTKMTEEDLYAFAVRIKEITDNLFTKLVSK